MIGLVIMILLFQWVIASKTEARVYNKLTNSKITTWDAMWGQYIVRTKE